MTRSTDASAKSPPATTTWPGPRLVALANPASATPAPSEDQVEFRLGPPFQLVPLVRRTEPGAAPNPPKRQGTQKQQPKPGHAHGHTHGTSKGKRARAVPHPPIETQLDPA